MRLNFLSSFIGFEGMYGAVSKGAGAACGCQAGTGAHAAVTSEMDGSGGGVFNDNLTPLDGAAIIFCVPVACSSLTASIYAFDTPK